MTSNEMTSSRRANSRGGQPAVQQKRVITNFSIDSIIGSARIFEDQNNKIATKMHKEAQRKELEFFDKDEKRTTTAKKKVRPKNFQCPACPMAFSNNGQLRNHVRIHTGERPFRCHLAGCAKTFTRNEELTRHKLIHSGFRPHACPSCGKHFGRKDHLKKHIRTHEKAGLGGSSGKRTGKRAIESCLETPSQVRGAREELAKQQAGSAMMEKACEQQQVFIGGQNNEIQKMQNNEHHYHSLLLDYRHRHAAAALNSPNAAGLFMPPPLPLPVGLQASQASPEAAASSSHLGHLATSLLPSTIQKLAQDYWQNWYHFLGHQHFH